MSHKSGWWKFHDEVREVTEVKRDPKLSDIIKTVIYKLEKLDRYTDTINSSWYHTNVRPIEELILELNDIHDDAYSKQFAINGLEYFNKTNDQSIKTDNFVLENIEKYKKRAA